MATLPSFPASAARPGLNVAVCVEERFLRERVCTALVSGGHSVVAREEDVDSVLASCSESSPEAVVLAARRVDGPTLAAVRRLRSGLPDASLVLVCERSSTGDVRKGLEAGIDGLVLADDLAHALAPVVAVVCAGQVSVPNAEREHVRGQVLTTREKQILGLVVMGLANAEIASKLYLAESTVKSHLSSAFTKLRVSSRNEAVALILNPERGRGLGILTIPSEQIPSPS